MPGYYHSPRPKFRDAVFGRSQEIVENFNLKHTGSTDDCLFVATLRRNGLTTSQIAKVVDTLKTTCRDCFNQPANCNCTRDE